MVWTVSLAALILGIAYVHLWRARRSRIQELEGEQQRLQDLCRQREQTLADTCLELRAPLYGMVALTEALLNAEAAGFSEEGRAHLAMIGATGSRCARALARYCGIWRSFAIAGMSTR